MNRARIGAIVVLGLVTGCHKSHSGQAGSPARQATAAERTLPSAQVQQAEEAGQRVPAELAARAAAATTGDRTPYFVQLPLPEFMGHVLQYAGDGIWKRQGYVIDKTGEHSLFPKSDQEWEDAESASRTLAEVTNVLLIPGRRVPEPGWDKAVLAVRKVALQAAAAAEKHDEAAFFTAGGDLDEACDVCHSQYDPKFKHQAKE